MPTPVCHVYCFSGSPFVWRVLLALEEKGIVHERTWIPRGSNAHASPEMLARNPRGKLPVLTWDGHPVYESLAIALFLEHQQPEPRLVPSEPGARARALSRALEAENYAVTAAMPALEAGLMRPPGTALTDADRERHRALHTELLRWEDYLADGAPYLAGDAFSLAEVALFPLLAFAVRCKLRLAPSFPALGRWYARLEPRPSVQASWPPHWRESEGRDLGLNEL